MFATNIISGILQRYKQRCAKYPQSSSFISNTNGDSFYLIRRIAGERPVQIRVSNHGTYLRTWCDREELGNSVERIDPALCDNISIVFVDDGNDITNDCEGRQDCEDCDIEPCIPQKFEGQNELGNPFKVIQYTYKSSQITPKYINGLVKAISEASVTGEYKDPLANLAKAAKTKSLSSDIYKRINENMNMKKKQVVRLNENQLTKMVTEAVKRVLKEYDNNLDAMSDSGKYPYYVAADVNSEYFKTFKEAYNYALRLAKNEKDWYDDILIMDNLKWQTIVRFSENGIDDFQSGTHQNW